MKGTPISDTFAAGQQVLPNLAIVEARVLDPASGAIHEGVTVYVEGGTIRGIEPGAVPGSAELVVNARGRTILPGLIDAHVHFASFADTHDQEMLGVTPETMVASTLRGAASAARMLASGVTTARDLGCKHAGIFGLRQAFATGQLRGPRLLVAGAGITMTGGTAHRSCAMEADGADAVRQVARGQVRWGADFVKMFISSGILHPSASEGGIQYTREELGAGIEEAHRAGMPAAIHASWDEGIRLSVELGADTIEHGHEITEAAAKQMAERGAFLVPTIWHYQRIALHGKEMGVAQAIIDRAKKVSRLHAESMIRAWKAGVPIAAGTDSGGPRYPSGSFHLELCYMAEVGMSPLDVLRSATWGAARCLRIDGRIGRMEPGYVGDLIGVSGDPLDDLSTLRHPWLVVKAGEVVLRRDD
jgi:imidazolonepropionase-like amidohydrolase